MNDDIMTKQQMAQLANKTVNFSTLESALDPIVSKLLELEIRDEMAIQEINRVFGNA